MANSQTGGPTGPQTLAHDRGPVSPGCTIFVTYRRDDVADATDRLADALRERFGTQAVFVDIDSLQPGADFVTVIDTWVGSCDALVVVIGPQWLDLTDRAGNRRLDDPSDFVRVEVEAGLRRGMPVFPVLLHGARMPSAHELPESIGSLARKNALVIDRTSWRYCVDRLIGALEQVGQDKTPLAATPEFAVASEALAGPAASEAPAARESALPSDEITVARESTRPSEEITAVHQSIPPPDELTALDESPPPAAGLAAPLQSPPPADEPASPPESPPPADEPAAAPEPPVPSDVMASRAALQSRSTPTAQPQLRGPRALLVVPVAWLVFMLSVLVPSLRYATDGYGYKKSLYSIGDGGESTITHHVFAVMVVLASVALVAALIGLLRDDARPAAYVALAASVGVIGYSLVLYSGVYSSYYHGGQQDAGFHGGFWLSVAAAATMVVASAVAARSTARAPDRT